MARVRADGPGRILALVSLVGLGGAAAPVAAHPSVSLVVTPDGLVYFSDLRRIWVLDPDGSFRVAVPGVHTHEIWLGPDGSVYGEDVQNEGETYRSRTWRLTPDGRLEDVAGWRPGHPRDIGYSLAAPAGDGLYWALGPGGTLRLIDEAGDAQASVRLGTEPVSPSWVVPDPAGPIVVRGGAVLRVSQDGRTEVLADGLIERTETFSFVHDRHALMKPWTGPDGAIYVPVYSGQEVVRLAGPAPPSVVLRSTGDWSPVGGTFTADGTLWVLEWSTDNHPRLRRIEASGDERLFGPPR
jgi:hypothetical protein